MSEPISQIQLDLQKYLQSRLHVWAKDALWRYKEMDLDRKEAAVDIFLSAMAFFLNSAVILKIPDEKLIEKVREGLILIRKSQKEYMSDVF